MFTSMVSSTSGQRSNEHGGKRRHTLALGVVGRHAHQAVHTVLTLQVAIGIVAADFDGTGLDACLVAFLQVGDGSLVTMSLGIAQVHAHQHAGPVLAFCTTCTGVDFEHTIHLVGFLAQHSIFFSSRASTASAALV